jgi:hypothetical protein
MGYSTEDEKIINAAVKHGKISPDYVRMWIHAMVADRAGTRRTLAELPAGWAATDPERAAKVVASASGGTVAAAAFRGGTLRGGGTNPPPAPPAAVDNCGMPIAGIPEPVLLRKGVDPATWTKEQEHNQFAHLLGGKFAIGRPKPPNPHDAYYWPSPNDHSELVNGEWVEKNPYREMP